MSASEQEMARQREKTLRSYDEYSILPSVATLINYNPTTNPTRLKFAQTIKLDHWLDPSYVHDLVFYELGRTIGLSEQKFIVNELLGGIPGTQVEHLDLETVTRAVTDLAVDGHKPSAILLPIELYQEVFNSWAAGGRLMSYHPQRLMIAGMEIRMLWSNKYNPFKRCFVLRRDFANWIARPSAEERVQVDFDQTGPAEMRVTVESRFDYRVVDAQAVKTFRISSVDEQD